MNSEYSNLVIVSKNYAYAVMTQKQGC